MKTNNTNTSVITNNITNINNSKEEISMNTTINNTVVDGIEANVVKAKKERKSSKKISGMTGKSIIDSILSYGYTEMEKTGRNWFIYDIPVDLINIDDSYQRVVNDSIVRAILRNYDQNRVDVKLVNFRFENKSHSKGKFWILDGQHTLTVEREMGHETLTCKVFIGLDKKEEAKLFSKQNEFRRSISAYAQFKAEVVAELYPACDIKRMCDNYNIQIKQARSFVPENTITSVRKMYEIVKKFGLEGLDFTLQTLIELGWNKIPSGMNERVLCISEAFPFCKSNKNNYAKLMATMLSFETPQAMIDFACDKYRDECRTSIRCVNMFVQNIF